MLKKYVLVENIDNYEVVKSQIEVKELPQNSNYRQVNKFLVPKDNKVIIYQDGVCKYLDNKKGTKYWLPGDKHDSEAREITELGETPPANALYEAPAKTEEDLENEKVAEAESELNAALPDLKTIAEVITKIVKNQAIPNELKNKFTEFDTNQKKIKKKLEQHQARLAAIKARRNREDDDD